MFKKPQRIEPGPGQESVWDYPRPPRVEPSSQKIEIVFGGRTIATTESSQRVLETSHPPVYYLPQDAFVEGVLRPNSKQTFCEFKGSASYFDLVVGEQVGVAAAWYYPRPVARAVALTDLVAVYPGRMDACFVDGEQVQAQAGDFYGGWITSAIVGPFKGASGTWGW
ncbi:MAG: DUF427 domain-containing protein [Acidobacteriota bacterium]